MPYHEKSNSGNRLLNLFFFNGPNKYETLDEKWIASSYISAYDSGSQNIATSPIS